MKDVRLFLLVLVLSALVFNTRAQGTWSNLGKGINHSVFALCADTVNNILYAGGEFDSAGSIAQNALAKWDGTNWDTTVSLQSGTSVYALIMYQGKLIVGFSDGNVGQYDGTTLTYLTKLNGAIYCFYIYKDTLYAGGDFYKSGNTILNCIGKWNGTKWLPVNSGVNWNNCCPYVSSMTEYNGDLIAAGLFNAAGSSGVSSIAAYDGITWKDVGFDLSNSGYIPNIASLEIYENDLYVLGNFNSVNSIHTNCNVMSWDGIKWDTLFNNANNSSLLPPANIKMNVFDNYLFISGKYNYNYQNPPYKYNGDTISTVDSGVGGGDIYAMTTWNGSLYVGGGFQFTVEAKPRTPCIAKWTPDSTTGIKGKVENDKEIIAYPNPTSNQLTFGNIISAGHLQIKNVLGQTLIDYNFSVGLQKQMIDVSILPQGIYFYRITDGNTNVVTGKFVKE